MDQDQWKLADEQIDHISQKLEELLDSAAMDDVKTLLSDLETKLGGRYGISLNCIVDLFDRDPERQCEHVLPLLNTGLSTLVFQPAGPVKFIEHGAIPVRIGTWSTGRFT